MLFMHGIVPSGPLQHHRFSGFRWIRNPKQPKSHTFSFLSSTDRMNARTAFGLPFMSDHVWASCLMFKMFRTCRNIILSLWLLIYFVLLRLQVLLRNCCTCFSQCTNSKMFVILRPWQATLPESSPHAFFSDVHMIVLVELYLGQWHQQDLLPAVQGLRNGLPHVTRRASGFSVS